MKKFTKILLALVLVIASVLAVTACTTVESISVKTAPQTTYLVGQNLNLADGELTALTSDGEVVVSMTDSEVSVSGYNSQQKGTQTLTVTYKNQSTTLDVKVVDRITAENYNKDYFVGDEFDTSAGRIRITRDNGTSYTVAINDEKLTFGKITATEAGESSVTVDYVNGTIEYSGEVAITIHDVENMKFVKPTKLSYYTHDEGINLAGGYITLIGNNGKLEKDIPLTKANVTGLDLTAVTKEINSATQKIYVAYGDTVFDYDVKVTYTDVNAIKANAQSFAGYDWMDVDMPDYTDSDGEKAIDTLKMYNELLDAHKSLITEDELLSVSRLAYAYAFDKWYADSENYWSTFIVDANGITLNCEVKDFVKADLEILKGDCDFYTYGDIFVDIVEAFPESLLGTALADHLVVAFYGYSLIDFGYDYEAYYGSMTFSDCTYVNIDSFKANILPFIQFMVQLGDSIPEACNVSNISNYTTQIKEAYGLIKNSEYAISQYAPYYYIVSGWRENDDLAEILFNYLYNDNVNTEGMNLLANVMLPDEVYEMYSTVTYLLEYAEVMQLDPSSAMDQNAMVYDSSEYMYYYFYLKDMEQNFKSGEYGEMEQYFYDNVLLNGWLGVTDGDYLCTNFIDELTYTSGGYYTILGSNYGLADSEAVLKKYVNVLGKVLPDAPDYDSDYASSDQYGQDVEELFDAFMALSPSEQSGFICILNVYYEYGLPEISFEQTTERETLETLFGMTLEDVLASMGLVGDAEDFFGEEINTSYYMTEFARIIVEYYKNKLTTINLDKAFHNLLIAIEYYTLGNSYEDAYDQFVNYLEEVTTAYNTVFSDAEKDEFDANFGTLYSKYVNIEKIYEDGYEYTDLGEWADDFALLEQAAQSAIEAYAMLQTGEVAASALYIASEKVNAIVEKIMTAPSDIIYAFNYEPILKYTYEEIDSEGNSGIVTYWYTGDFYASYVRYSLNEVTSIIDMHGIMDADVNAFFAKAYDVTFGYALLPDGETLDQKVVVDTMKAFDSLSAIDKELVYLFDIYSGSEYPFYVLMLVDYFSNTMTEAAADLATSLIMDLQVSCVFYEIEGTEDYLEELKIVLEEITTTYDTVLSDEDKESFAFIYEIYESWVDKCEELIADAENTNE